MPICPQATNYINYLKCLSRNFLIFRFWSVERKRHLIPHFLIDIIIILELLLELKTIPFTAWPYSTLNFSNDDFFVLVIPLKVVT